MQETFEALDRVAVAVCPEQMSFRVLQVLWVLQQPHRVCVQASECEAQESGGVCIPLSNRRMISSPEPLVITEKPGEQMERL